MVKAASLLYAIYISLVIAILCAGLMLMFTFKMDLDTYFLGKTQLLHQNRAAMSHILYGESSSFDIDEIQEVVSSDGITTKMTMHNWGVFDVCSVVSYLKKDTIKQHTLIARGQSKNKPALYLRNNDTPLKISGDTYILGDVFVSGYGLEKTTITGGSLANMPKHIGKIRASEKQLPNFKISSFSYPEKYTIHELGTFKGELLVNEFDTETIVLEVANTLRDIHLKGNIIVQSKDTLVIGSTAFLEDVIVVAPKVIYESGFKGNTQTFTNSDVIVEKYAQLTYPSIIAISGSSDKVSFIHIQDYAGIDGAIILDGNGLATENKKRIQVDENAVVKGDVFCDGVLSLYGVVEGSVITSSLLHKTNTAVYTNLIYGGEIHAQKLSSHFFELPIVDFYKSQEMLAIKQL